jgi:hypothetical protein
MLDHMILTGSDPGYYARRAPGADRAGISKPVKIALPNGNDLRKGA